MFGAAKKKKSRRFLAISNLRSLSSVFEFSPLSVRPHFLLILSLLINHFRTRFPRRNPSRFALKVSVHFFNIRCVSFLRYSTFHNDEKIRLELTVDFPGDHRTSIILPNHGNPRLA